MHSNLNSHPAVPSPRSWTFKQSIMVFHWAVTEGNNKWKHFAFLFPILWYSVLLHLIENFLSEIFWVYTILQYMVSSQKGHRQGSSEYGHAQLWSVWLPESHYAELLDEETRRRDKSDIKKLASWVEATLKCPYVFQEMGYLKSGLSPMLLWPSVLKQNSPVVTEG